jgi:drug/metabolite transporter (DMT)-like permease
MGAARGPSGALLYSALSLMAFFWAVNFIAGKIALREFPAPLLAGLRVSIAAVVMAPIYCWDVRRNRGRRWAWRDLPLLIFLGSVGVALNQLFFVLGLSRTSVAHAALIVGLGPIVVLLIASALRMEPLTPLKLSGMLLSFAGIAVLQGMRSHGTQATLIGDVTVFAGSAMFAIFTVAGKRATATHGSIVVNAFAYIGGAVMLAPLTLWQSAHFEFGAVSSAGWGSLLFMSVFPSVVCYLIYYWALKHCAASCVSAFSYLQTPGAMLLAVLFMGEPLTWALAGGGALVFTGVYLTRRRAPETA